MLSHLPNCRAYLFSNSTNRISESNSKGCWERVLVHVTVGAIKCAEVGFVCCAAGQCLHFINNTVVWFGFLSSYSISYVVFSLLKCNLLIVKVLFYSCNKYLNSKYNIIKKMISDQIYKTELKLKELRMSILKNFPINKNNFMPKLSTFLSLT